MECNDCHQEKDEIQFATFKSRSGETRRRGICKVCRGKYALENRERLTKWRQDYNAKNRSKKSLSDAKNRKRAQDYVNAVKSAGVCADCKKSFHPVAMDFDHGNNPKTRSVASMVSGAYRLRLIQEEIAKCELVCACCHRVRTWTRGEHNAPTANRL